MLTTNHVDRIHIVTQTECLQSKRTSTVRQIPTATQTGYPHSDGQDTYTQTARIPTTTQTVYLHSDGQITYRHSEMIPTFRRTGYIQSLQQDTYS